MATQLILSKPEINPDVFFVNTGQTYWNFGTGWTFGVNNVNGLGAEKLNTALSNLQLYVYVNGVATATVLAPYTTYKWTCRVEFVTNSGGGDSVSLIVGGVTIQTFPASGAAVIYTGEFTTAASGTVLFTSTAGNSVLISYLNLVEAPTDYEIEITDDIDVPLTYNIADIADPSKRNSDFSRTVNIPGTKENNQFFNQIYEIDSSGTYNMNKKVSAMIINDGILQFSGFCKLDNINRLANGLNNYSSVSYDITLFGNVGDLFFKIGDTLLSDLDLSEYDHTYSRTNQRNSWYTEIVRNGATYANVTNGANLTISSVSNNGGRAQMNFSGNHGLAVGDWILIPLNSIVSPSGFSDPKFYYLGEHMVYSVPSATQAVIQCPYFAPAVGFSTKSSGSDRVRKHSKTGEGYVYPVIDYDQNNGYEFMANQLYPAIYVKEIIDKIFSRVQLTYDSALFDSVIFKKLICPSNSGVLKLLNTEVEARLFSATSTNNQTNSFNLTNSFGSNYVYSGGAISPIDIQIDDDSTAPFFDNSGVFNTATYRYTPSATGIYTLEIGAIVSFNYQNTGGISWVNYLGPTATIQIEVYNYTSGTVVTNCIAQHAPTTFPAHNVQAATVWIQQEIDNVSLSSSSSYGVRLRVVNIPESVFTGAGATIQINWSCFGTSSGGSGVIFKNKVKNTNVQLGDTIYMNSILPKMKCTEFLKNIINIFNLYIDKDKQNDKKFYIEPRDVYYAAGTDVDWTDRLDTGQQITQEPLAQKFGKIQSYNYAEDGDLYNKDHKEKYGYVYGNRRAQIDNDFVNNEYRTDLTFASTVLTDLNLGVVSNIQGGEDTDNAQSAFSSKLRILVFNCNSSAITTSPGGGWWYHTVTLGDLGEAISSLWLSGGFATGANKLYPYAGHLDKPDAPFFDLNFDYPKGVYFDYDSWTDRNAWNLYHRKGYEEVTNRDAKLITCYLRLTARDIFSLDFRDRFKIDGHYLRLNKISDFIVGKNLPVKCEFIKINDMPAFPANGFLEFTEYGTGFAENEGFLNGLAKYALEGNSGDQGSANRVSINGNSTVGKFSYNVIVNGDGNNIGNSTSNIVVTGYNNVVYPNLTDVFLINTNGVTVTESGKSYLNGQDVTNIQAKILRIST